MPFRKSARIEIVNQSDKPISLLYYNIDWIKKDKLPEDTPYFYAQYRQEYPCEHGKDYVVLDTKGKGHYVGTVLAVRTRSPAWFGEGDEKIYIDGETKAVDLGHRHGGLLSLRLGTEAHEHALFRRPVFRPVGHRRRPHERLSLAHQRSDRLQHGHQGHLRALRLDFAGRESAAQIDELERARGRLCQRGLLVSDRPIDLHRPRAACPRAHAAEPRARHRPSGRRSSMPSTTATATSRSSSSISIRSKQLLYMPKQADKAWLEIPFEVKKKEPLRLLLNMTKSYDFGKYQASLNGVKLGDAIDLYSPKVVNEEVHLLDFWPEPGTYTLRLECVGKNVQSEGYYCGIESVRLRERRPRVAEMAHEKNDDWKKSPRLYQ